MALEVAMIPVVIWVAIFLAGVVLTVVGLASYSMTLFLAFAFLLNLVSGYMAWIVADVNNGVIVHYALAGSLFWVSIGLAVISGLAFFVRMADVATGGEEE